MALEEIPPEEQRDSVTVSMNFGLPSEIHIHDPFNELPDGVYRLIDVLAAGTADLVEELRNPEGGV